MSSIDNFGMNIRISAHSIASDSSDGRAAKRELVDRMRSEKEALAHAKGGREGTVEQVMKLAKEIIDAKAQRVESKQINAQAKAAEKAIRKGYVEQPNKEKVFKGDIFKKQKEQKSASETEIVENKSEDEVRKVAKNMARRRAAHKVQDGFEVPVLIKDINTTLENAKSDVEIIPLDKKAVDGIHEKAADMIIDVTPVEQQLG